MASQDMLPNSPGISAVWCDSLNFGDKLVPWMIEKVTRRWPILAARDADYQHFIAGGSILNWSNQNSCVWGAGLASVVDEVHKLADIRMVRGPVSRFLARKHGASVPDLYGDPALILPKWITRPKTKYRLGIVPHYVDQYKLMAWYGKNEDIKIINMLRPVEEVVRSIGECEKIVSSALHGLVVADAYGIPNIWAKFSDSIGGDGTKYHDYFCAVNRSTMYDCPMAVDLRETKIPPDVNWYRKHRDFQVGEFDPDKIFDACPFRGWNFD